MIEELYISLKRKPKSTSSSSANQIIQYLPINMSKPTLKNIGVYTNPNHDLWVADAEPSLEKLDDLKVGEVTVGIKSTGICGLVITCLSSPPREVERGDRAMLILNF